MRNSINRASRKILTVLAASSLMMGIIGCQGPEEITEFHRLAATNGDTYEVNLIMLSELSGRILPQKDKKITIVKDNNQDYCLKGKLDSDTDKCAQDSILTDIITVPEDESQIFITPYKKYTDSFNDDKIECIANENSEYECIPYFSGMTMIEKIWNNLFDQNAASIHIGNGDVYGVSNGFSKDHHNVPTILTLNQLGFDVDTFGNHTFDDSDSLKYLREHIKTAQFSFTVSNLSNVIQNLKDVNTFKIIDIPSTNAQNRPLHVAVVGVVDTLLGDTISTGYMGTLTSTSYCNAIYAMEDAYNLNARAFVILAHVFSSRPDCLSLFIKTLHDALLDENINSTCPNSRLIITNEMLEESQKQRKLGNKKKLKTDDLRAEIRRDIFNNILAIFNEEGDKPIFSTIEGYDDFLQYEGMDLSNTNLFIVNNQFVTNYYDITDETNKRSFLDNYYQFKYEHTPVTNEDDDENKTNPLLYVQFPSKGSHTAKVSFTITARDQSIVTDTTKTIAKNYQAQLNTIELQPILSSGNKQIQNKKVTDKYDYSTCSDQLKKFSNTYHLSKCNQYFKDYVSRLKGNDDTLTDIKTCFNEVSCAIKYDKSLCDKEFSETALETKDLETLFSCLYNATLWEYNPDSGTLEKPTICNLKNYTVAGENRNYETRAFSTFIGNFITDIVLNELRKKTSDNEYDLTVMNSGTARDTSDFSEIDTEFFKDYFPFANDLYLLEINVKQLHDYIEYGLNPNTEGGFPIFSGIKVFYHEKSEEEFAEDRANPKNPKPETTKKKKIVEIWSTDQNNEIVSPIYIESCENNNSYEQCIKDKTCCLEKGSSKLCDNDECMEQLDSPINKSSYKVVITKFMTTAGDGYPTFPKNKPLPIIIKNKAQTITGLIRDALDNGADSDDHSCGLILSTGEHLQTEGLLQLLISKHHFTDTDIMKNDSYHKDLENNKCVATQEMLFDDLVNKGAVPQNYCAYSDSSSPEG